MCSEMCVFLDLNVCVGGSGNRHKTKYFHCLNVWKASWHVKMMMATESHKSWRACKTPIHQRCHGGGGCWADTWHAPLELGHISCRSKSCFLLQVGVNWVGGGGLWRWKTDGVLYKITVSLVFFPYFMGFKWLWWDTTHVGLTRSSCSWWIQATCCEWSDQASSFFFFKEGC